MWNFWKRKCVCKDNSLKEMLFCGDVNLERFKDVKCNKWFLIYDYLMLLD